MPTSKKSLDKSFFTPGPMLSNVNNFATAMIDVWEYETRKYVYVTKAITYICGYDPDDLFKGGVDFVVSKIHPDDRAEVVRKNVEGRKKIEYYKQGVDDSKPFASFEYRIWHKDGYWVWLHSDASAYSRTTEGKLEYVISTSVNINEQKIFEEKLLETTERLKKSQARLRRDHEQLLALNIARDEFVSVASHQLRTPATTVKQYIGLLLQKFTDNLSETQIKFLQAAYDSNERELHTIEDLLRNAQIEAGNIKPYKSSVILNELVQSVVEESTVRYGARRQKLAFQSPKQPIAVRCDEHLVRMVLENLVDNASKYSPEGKSVEMRLHTKDNFATVDIKDHGYGISRTERSKLFQKYTRLQSPKTSGISGTGLGLYWAKQIVELHGGAIRLTSSSKNGSTFTFTLPL